MIPIYIAFLWHMHQPLYWPGESVMETEAAAHYGFSVLTVHLDRTGPYTAWPIDAVRAAMDAGLGSCGAQVSFSGSLIDNLGAIEAAGAGFIGGKTGWNNAGSWTTSLGNPRIDMVSIGHFHPIMPLVGHDAIEMQIEMHRRALGEAFPDAAQSKGIFPPETGFSPEMIPALRRAGIEWAIVDNIHFDRTLSDYPWRSGSNLFPPNRAEQLSDAATSWVELTGIWAPTAVAAPWGYQPHRVRYVDPETGEESEIIAVPGARYEGNEDARGGFGALNYDEVLSQLADYNTDPDHPILVVLHHDGDNYGGGTDSYYHSNFSNFISWLQTNPDRFVCTTIQDYLDTFPPADDDVIHVEPGSWSGADNGDPEFGKWNGDPDDDGYSPDRNSWAVITAARNRVETANDLDPYSSVEDVKNGAGNATAKALHWLMLAETSCYWYWDGAEGGIWDSHPTRASNMAMAEADIVIDAHGGEDDTPPTIHMPQREPYNPGEFEWSGEREPGDFEVWTFIYDVSDLAEAVLYYRLDDNGALTRHNNVFSTGGWCDIPMEEVALTPDTDPLPAYQASLYRAVISDVENEFVDYYVEAEDGHGNTAASPILHTWVGSAGGSTPGGLLFYPESPTKYDEITVLSGREADLHWGVNTWTTPPEIYWPDGTVDYEDGHAVETPMTDADGDTVFEATLGPFDDPGNVVDDFDFIFHYPDDSWSGTDVFVPINNAPGDDPHVFIVSPVDGGVVSGTWTIHVTASDNGSVLNVEILVDGESLAVVTEAPYTASWDTTALEDGSHSVRAEARDGADNTGFAQISVQVRNGSAGDCVIHADGSDDAGEDAPDAADAMDGVEADVPADALDALEGDVPADAVDAAADGGSDPASDTTDDTGDGDGSGNGCSCAFVL